MKRFLLISLLALPLSADPAGSRFQRGGDPRWADPTSMTASG